MGDIAGFEVEGVRIGDPTCAVHDPIGSEGLFGPVMLEGNGQTVSILTNRFNVHTGFDRDLDAFGFRLNCSHRIGIHARQ